MVPSSIIISRVYYRRWRKFKNLRRCPAPVHFLETHFFRSRYTITMLNCLSKVITWEHIGVTFASSTNDISRDFSCSKKETWRWFSSGWYLL